MAAPPPPPRRTVGSPAPPSAASASEQSTWKGRFKAAGGVWGKKAVDKSVAWSDSIGGKVNGIAEKRFGTEAFWPVTGDLPKEMDKAARILRAFTVEGVVKEEKFKTEDTADQDGTGDGNGSKRKEKTKKVKVLRKIPPEVIAQAKGMAIFTSMRTGFAPFGGAGGTGVVVARLSDGTWSAPTSISPNNLSTGLLLGVDVYDCILVLRSQEALDTFNTHKVTLGVEIGVAAGPYGTGAAVEAGLEKVPVFSYVRSRGMYAGVELVGQVFVERFEENAVMYHWPGVKAGDILAGKVRVPIEAANLQQALKDAESGRAQKEKGDALDVIVPDGGEVSLSDGEVLKLPPTPDMTDGTQYQSDPDTEKVTHRSYPGSANASTILLSPSPAPPLPPRAQRPGPIQHHSSMSQYSNVDEEMTMAPISNLHISDSSVPLDGSTTIAGPSPAGETWNEAERREWDQHIAGQAPAEQRVEFIQTREPQQYSVPPPTYPDPAGIASSDEKEGLR